MAAQAASSIVEGLQAEATKARASGERHQEMVATLTADNLVFLMRLKRCEGDLTAAVQERDELRLEVEEQRGPWIEEVVTSPGPALVDVTLQLPFCTKKTCSFSFFYLLYCRGDHAWSGSCMHGRSWQQSRQLCLVGALA